MTDELREVQRIGPALSPPVKVLKCYACCGDGWIELRVNKDGVGEIVECAICCGRGRIATEGGEA